MVRSVFALIPQSLGNLEYTEKICREPVLSTTNSIWISLGLNPGADGGRRYAAGHPNHLRRTFERCGQNRSLLIAVLLTKIVPVRNQIAWDYANKNQFPYAGVVYPVRNSTNHFIAALITPSWLLVAGKGKHEFPADNNASKWNFIAVMGITEFAFDGSYVKEGAQERRVIEAGLSINEGPFSFHCVALLRTDKPFNIIKGRVETIPFLDVPRWPWEFQVTCDALMWSAELSSHGGCQLRTMQFRPKRAYVCESPPHEGYTICAFGYAHQKLCATDPKTALIVCQNAVTAFYARFFTTDQDCHSVRDDPAPSGRLLLSMTSLRGWLLTTTCREAVQRSHMVLPIRFKASAQTRPQAPAPAWVLFVAIAAATTAVFALDAASADDVVVVIGSATAITIAIIRLCS